MTHERSTPAPGVIATRTDAQLRPIVAGAIRRWKLTGLTAAERQLLRSATVHVGDLDGAALGLTTGTAVTIDRDAAGYGWFVDTTPRSDAEFRRKGDPGERGFMDLLTAVEHELGHVIGRDHAPARVMSERLAAGTRESIVSAVRLGTRPVPPCGRTGFWPAADGDPSGRRRSIPTGSF